MEWMLVIVVIFVAAVLALVIAGILHDSTSGR